MLNLPKVTNPLALAFIAQANANTLSSLNKQVRSGARYLIPQANQALTESGRSAKAAKKAR